MPRIIEFLEDDQLLMGLVEGEEKQKLRVSDEGGRLRRVSAERILFEHQGRSIEALRELRDGLAAEVDVVLLCI